MKIRIYNIQLNKFVEDEKEWFINCKKEVFYRDIMDGELIICPYCLVSFESIADGI